MCGLVGIVGNSDVAVSLYDTLTVLQHRGQDAAGIATCDNGKLNLRKDNGLVKDVFRTRHMRRLTGKMGIGHVRYPTAGSSSPALAQPFYVNSPYGLCLAHNGNLTNSAKLSEELYSEDLRHINTDSDSEVLLNIFAHELQQVGRVAPTAEDVFQAVEGVHRRCRGGYVALVMITGYGIVGFRDKNGIRPLVFGKKEVAGGQTEYMLASESVALDSQGFDLVRDVAPGEAVYIDSKGNLHTRICSEPAPYAPCIFEHVYFARPDSLMDGISVYKARLRMGERLADKVKRLRPDHDIDVVIPIPDTSRTSALELANHLGVKYREGFVKNRYIGRTFIMPGQSERRKSVRQKLNAIELEFRGKNVLLVDDSIVRGTTCRQIIQMAREAGARKVYFASAAPPVRYPNVYGIDMPAATELIAHDRTEQQVQELIGADWLVFQDLPDLIAAAHEGNPKIKQFECAVFNGEYITGDVDQQYLKALEAARNDAAKKARANTKAEPANEES
ncbi:amidophosphoribosyltransferase [Pseudohongiella sp. SYSU M77423]|uniref:amidophosphoribosyltransferase n=1 Tax=Pseudohongiella sp. SYSU M77423 TaxID=3042312 RepID=UPI0024810DD6|nr:amidophosphoribosyltransferase [Pseudohongiella sp. SYSU M77423]MDH7945081.1 amidophosphoribosyltransferase [Pseudohongiella sp. SYSU M77423]